MNKKVVKYEIIKIAFITIEYNLLWNYINASNQQRTFYFCFLNFQAERHYEQHFIFR